MYEEIRCPDCFIVIDNERIDLNDKVAYCTSCEKRFSIQPALEGIRLKYESIAPVGWEVRKTPNHQKIIIPFSTFFTGVPGVNFILKTQNVMKNITLSVVLVFLVVFIIGYTNQELSRGNYYSLIMAWIVFTAIIFVIGFILYEGVGSKPGIEIDMFRKQLKIKFKNMDGHKSHSTAESSKNKNQTISQNNIRQVYIESISFNNVPAYEMIIKLKDDTEIRPIIPFFNLSNARYIEQEIERFYEIRDVKGENEYLP